MDKFLVSIITPTYNHEEFIGECRKILQELLLCRNSIVSSTVIVRKNTLLSMGGFQQPPYLPTLDYPTWLRLALEGEFEIVDAIIGYWRRHDLQTTTLRRIEIGKGVSRFVQEFYNHLPIEIKSSLKLTNKTVIKSCRNSIAWAYFYDGRADLINKNWSEARKKFVKTVSNGSFLTKFKATLGLIASYLKFDIEGLAKTYNNFRPNIHKWSGYRTK